MKYLLIASILVLPLNALSQEDRTVSVRGEGLLQITPDIAHLNLEIIAKSKDARNAQAQNAKAMENLIKKLKTQFKIESNDIQTSNFSLQPIYRYEKNGKQIFENFQASHSLSVKIRKLESLGNLLDKIMIEGSENSSLQISSISFDTDKRKEYELQALESAMSNAYSRAEALTKFSKVELSGVRRISDSHVSYQPYRAKNFDLQTMSAKAIESETQIQAGEITISANVNVEYDIK